VFYDVCEFHEPGFYPYLTQAIAVELPVEPLAISCNDDPLEPLLGNLGGRGRYLPAASWIWLDLDIAHIAVALEGSGQGLDIKSVRKRMLALGKDEGRLSPGLPAFNLLHHTPYQPSF